MVEFALVAPILFGVIFLVIQGGLLYAQYQQVGFAASEAARCAAVARDGNQPACAPSASGPEDAARTEAIANAPLLQLQDSDITVNGGDWSVPGSVSVTVRHPAELPILQIFGVEGTAFELEATSTARLER